MAACNRGSSLKNTSRSRLPIHNTGSLAPRGWSCPSRAAAAATFPAAAVTDPAAGPRMYRCRTASFSAVPARASAATSAGNGDGIGRRKPGASSAANAAASTAPAVPPSPPRQWAATGPHTSAVVRPVKGGESATASTLISVHTTTVVQRHLCRPREAGKGESYEAQPI